MTRREFILAGSAALGGGRSGGASRPTGGASRPRRAAAARRDASPHLAFQVYGVRDLCAKDFEDTLRAARAIGYEGVETGRFYGLDAKGLKSACDDAGLELVALQLYPHILARWRTLRRASSI